MEDTDRQKTPITKDRILRNESLRLDDLIFIQTQNRIGQIREIKSALESSAQGKKGENLFIFGKSGTGKTKCIRESLSSVNPSQNIVYLNCHEYGSRTAIFNAMASKLNNSFSRRGFASYEIANRVKEIMVKERKQVLLVLDDFGFLPRKDASDVLHTFIGQDGFSMDSLSIVLVSHSDKDFLNLDAKIRGAYLFRSVCFEPYNREELRAILAKVVSLELHSESCGEDVLAKIAELSLEEEGHMRFAISLLFLAARCAEERGVSRIGIEDVDRGYSNIGSKGKPGVNAQKEAISDEERLIIRILSEGEKSSSEIYDHFLKHSGKSKRQVRNYLARLVEKGVLDYKVLNDDPSPLKPKVFRLKQGGFDGTNE